MTGIRSEFDILFPILNSLNNDKRFELKLVLSGSHLSDWHGEFIEKISDMGFDIADKIDSLLMTNRTTQRIKGVGMLCVGLSQVVERENPDILFVIGDREESISTALVGNYMNKLVAHFGGGDTVFGNADDPVRFAVSKPKFKKFVDCPLTPILNLFSVYAVKKSEVVYPVNKSLPITKLFIAFITLG